MQLHQPLPQRVVVVGRVEAQRVDPRGHLAAGRHLAGNKSTDHHCLEAQLGNGEVELLDGLFGGVGGNGRHRGEAVLQTLVAVGQVAVERPAELVANFVVAVGGEVEADAGVANRKVHAQLLDAVVEHRWGHRGGEVPGVGQRQRPPRPPEGASGEPIIRGEARPVGLAVERAVGHLGVQPSLKPLVEAVLVEGRVVLEHVPVGVDDGMAEVGPDVGGGSLAAHSGNASYYR